MICLFFQVSPPFKEGLCPSKLAVLDGPQRAHSATLTHLPAPFKGDFPSWWCASPLWPHWVCAPSGRSATAACTSVRTPACATTTRWTGRSCSGATESGPTASAATGPWTNVVRGITKILTKTPTDSGVTVIPHRIVVCAVADGHVCDPLCSDSGCWGPGPDQCLSCRNYGRHGTCVAGCHFNSGSVRVHGFEKCCICFRYISIFFPPRIPREFAGLDGECIACHPECKPQTGKASCTGPVSQTIL